MFLVVCIFIVYMLFHLIFVFEQNEVVVANTNSTLCFWLPQNKGLKSHINNLIVSGYFIFMGLGRET